MRNALVGQGWSIHGFSRRAAILIAASLVVGVCGGTLIAAEAHAGNDRAPHTDERFDEAAMNAERRHEERLARRATASERDARVRSRTAYRGLDRAAARALARRSFGILAADVWAPLRLEPGERFAGYLNDYAAQIDREDGPPLVAKTFVPMRDRDSEGRPRRVSLALRAQATAIVADNPLLDFSIAKASDGPLRLQRSGITVSAMVDTVAGEVEDDRVFAESVATDLDQVIAPTTLGGQFMWQVRSEDAPESVRLRFGLPDGARLRLARDELAIATGPITEADSTMPRAVEVVRGDEILALVDPPLAVDADGESVASYYELDGSDVLVRFAHRGEDLKYPLLVDPVVEEKWEGADWGSDGWVAQQYLLGGPGSVRGSV